ncbi:hypothetical protein HK15_01890 [Acetobacter orientalis]|uniref:Uncharacterized protein n=1 Tax=Acetobacter orientalis TaxID=146474 RepID=A0A252AZU2_9PROT|nr:hypothetical protein HK15_01890 [Acetobacter orientalis]
MHHIATVGRMGKQVEVIPDTRKLMAYPAHFIGNAWPIMSAQFCTGQEGVYSVGGSRMAKVTGNSIPVLQFSRAGSHR